MPTYPDYTDASRHSDSASFDKLIFANNVPALASEDVEVQDIVNSKIKRILKLIYGDSKGFVRNPTFTIDKTNKKIIFDKNAIVSEDFCFEFSTTNGSFVGKVPAFYGNYGTTGTVNVFVEIFQKVIKKNDVIYSDGIMNNDVGIPTINNYLVDSVVGDETSRRIQNCATVRFAFDNMKFARGNNVNATNIPIVFDSNTLCGKATGSALNTVGDVVYVYTIGRFSLDTQEFVDLKYSSASFNKHKESHVIGGNDAIAPVDIGAANAVHKHVIADTTGMENYQITKNAYGVDEIWEV